MGGDEDDGWTATRHWRETVMGMKKEFVGSTGMNRTVGYVSSVYGVLMNLTHPACWLQSCYSWQGKCSINT